MLHWTQVCFNICCLFLFFLLISSSKNSKKKRTLNLVFNFLVIIMLHYAHDNPFMLLGLSCRPFTSVYPHQLSVKFLSKLSSSILEKIKLLNSKSSLSYRSSGCSESELQMYLHFQKDKLYLVQHWKTGFSSVFLRTWSYIPQPTNSHHHPNRPPRIWILEEKKFLKKYEKESPIFYLWANFQILEGI